MVSINKAFKDMTLDELHQEKAYWEEKIAGWGAALSVANEFRNECESWIRRKSNDVSAT
jgi:hypothetical protein